MAASEPAKVIAASSGDEGSSSRMYEEINKATSWHWAIPLEMTGARNLAALVMHGPRSLDLQEVKS